MAGANGFRRVPQLGNANAGTSASFNYVLGKPYYWSVQAVDTAWAGSAFAAEANFKFVVAPAPVNGTNPVPGDVNGDGIVSQSELDQVLANYWPYSPFLYMTNVAGLGSTNITFALSNSTAGAFTAEFSTNLSSWFVLGPASPRYLIVDTNGVSGPQRYYRLRWP
jgi:hypothetical protein